MTRRGAMLGAAAAALLLALSTSLGAGNQAAARGGIGFAPAVYVSPSLAGGEPFVIYSHGGKDLVYSSHEGTTHIDRTYATTPGSSCDLLTVPPSGFVCSYNNQVITWFSTDQGKTWTKSLENPLATGFSDPSLTEDEGGVVYNTGIDLANDAVFASTDGAKTFVAGTPQCHDGDRPWLAGGRRGEVFMSTDAPEQPGSGHVVYHGKVTFVGGAAAALTCGLNGIKDTGAYTNPAFPHTDSYSGFGQLYYDHHDGSLVEPADFTGSGSGGQGVGISVLDNASAFSGSFVPHEGVLQPDGQLASWPAITIDAANTIYVVWESNPRTTTTTGCGGPSKLGGPSLAPNSVFMISTRDKGRTWSAPVTVAHPGTTVLWPWVTAGSAGNVAVAWYQSDQVTDPDCDSAALLPGGKPTTWTVHVANYYGLLGGSPVVALANPVPSDALHPGGVIHTGGICQTGTTCAATGQDRRLGDYFTVYPDQFGCDMIATGDTQMTDPILHTQLALSRPLFLHQDSGPSLTGYDCATHLLLNAGPTPTATATATAAPSATATATPAPTPGLANTRGALVGAVPVLGAAVAVSALFGGARSRRRRRHR